MPSNVTPTTETQYQIWAMLTGEKYVHAEDSDAKDDSELVIRKPTEGNAINPSYGFVLTDAGTDDDGTQWYYIQNISANQYVEPKGGSEDSGKDIVIDEESGNDAQRWRLDQVTMTSGSEEYTGYVITNEHSGDSWKVHNDSTGDGTHLQQEAYTSGDNNLGYLFGFQDYDYGWYPDSDDLVATRPLRPRPRLQH